MIKSKIIKHPGLAVISLVLAFIIWFIITNYRNPVITRTITGVPVNVINASHVESMGLSYSLAAGYDTVSVTVRGNRSNVESLRASNITVDADLTQLISLDTSPVMVPLSVTIPGIPPENCTANPRNIGIELEERVSKDFVITASNGNTKPANGYEIGVMTVEPEKVTVRGPNTLIDRIDRIIAMVDVTNKSRSGVYPSVIKVMDKNGEELDDTKMSSLSFSTDQSLIRVNVTFYKVQSGVKVTVETSGEPAAGYQIGEIVTTPATISVVGDETALKELSDAGNTITITSGSQTVDCTGAKEDFDVRVDIRDFLPESLRLAEEVTNVVMVSVHILPYNSKLISIESQSIAKENLDSTLNCVFDVSKVDIKVQGTDQALSSLTKDAVRATVDLTGLSEGSHVVPVNVTLPEGLELVENVSVSVTLSKTRT